MRTTSSSPSPAAAFERIDFPAAGLPADANIRVRYPAEKAAWIWHGSRLNETAFLRFTLEFALESEEELTFQVSADQRFQLSIDGAECAYGPDRSDVSHWSLQTYQGRLQAGRHTVSALVWWIADAAYGVPDAATIGQLTGGVDDSGRSLTLPVPPMAQCSFRGGFLFAALGRLSAHLDTGAAPWKVEDLTHAVALEKRDVRNYHDIGPAFVVDGAQWNRPGAPSDPVIVKPPGTDTLTGVARAGWKLESSPLPEQHRALFSGGRVCEVREGNLPAQAWQDLLSGKAPLRIEPHQTATALWDLQDYLCGYPALSVRGGGTGSAVGIEWAEALYDVTSPREAGGQAPKGRRDQTHGKAFFGFGDRFACSGGSVTFPAFWWRSGRFVEIRVVTGAEPLVIERLALKTTRYPIAQEGVLRSDDPALDEIVRLCARTIQAGTHELFTDSPYYEQMAYVGDNVTEALVTYAMTHDTRITRRAVTMFDWSRAATGLVAERWPCALYQGSATYAMLWPSMVRNHAWWRDEPGFVRERLRGVRQLVEELTQYLGPDALPGRLPGWSFVDWVPEWTCGYPPAHEDGDSSLIAMHWVHCLQSAADLERAFGDAELHRRLQRLEAEAKASILRRFYAPETGLFFDDGGHRHLSEHAQVLASLLGITPPDAGHWLERLRGHTPARCSVYFTHYLLDALWREGRSEPFFEHLGLWRSFLEYGLCTIPEQPEPTRSDCHAWGAHPLFHACASIAGIRPASPGFRTVRIRPMLGPLRQLEGRMPHPHGEIAFSFRAEGRRAEAQITLPEGIQGTLEAGARIQPLAPGRNAVCWETEVPSR